MDVFSTMVNYLTLKPPPKSISLRFSRNSEAFVSQYLGNLEEMFTHCYMRNVVRIVFTHLPISKKIIIYLVLFNIIPQISILKKSQNPYSSRLISTAVSSIS